MKSFISGLFIAAALVAFSIIYTARLSSVSQELRSGADSISAALDAGDLDRAAQLTRSLRGRLKDCEGFLAAFGDHGDILLMETDLAELSAYTEKGDMTAALAKAGVLSELFMHLPQNSRILPENIL